MVKKPDKWDMETEVLVVGSGAAGLAAAILAHDNGAKVTLIERTDKVGGTTAVSGGGIWIPDNHLMKEKGISDSKEDAFNYCKHLSGGKTTDELIKHYLDTGPDVVKYLLDHTPLQFEVTEMPDYHPELEGAHKGDESRTLGPLLFDTNELGEGKPNLRVAPTMSMPMTFAESRDWKPTCTPEKVPWELIGERIEKGITCWGGGLAGPLFKAILDRDINPVLNTRALKLVFGEGSVIGLLAQQDGKDVYIRASKGIILASGGFEWNEELKAAFMPGMISHPCSPPINEGDGLKMAISAGAALGNMCEHWGWVSAIIPGEESEGIQLNRGIIYERAMPHCIIVNSKGKRFVNEAAAYNDMFKPFWAMDENTVDFANLPAWCIFDQQYKDLYPFLTAMPREDVPEWIVQADSLNELAEKIGVDTDGLKETVEKFNTFAKKGEDRDFARGKSQYDAYWADDRNKPVGTLGTIEKPKFYACEMLCGSLGTKGGPKTDINAQVMDVYGEPVSGLYAAGNVMASVAGGSYYGGGATLGPALVFGYLAGKHAANQ